MANSTLNLSLTGNNSSLANTTEADGHRALDLVLASVQLTIGLLTITLNAIIIAAFIQDERIRTPFNLNILFLSASDFLMGSVNILPRSIGTLAGHLNPFGFRTCTFILWAELTVLSGATYSVFLISLDRAWSVFFPVHYRHYRSKKLTVVICAFCLTAAQFCIVPLVALDRVRHPMPDMLCLINASEKPVFALIKEVLIFDMPLLGVIVCYIGIILKLKSRRRYWFRRTVAPSAATTTMSAARSTAGLVGGTTEQEPQNRAVMERSELRMYLALSWLVLVVIVCWGPTCTFFTLITIDFGYWMDEIYYTVLFLENLTCVLNPLIYHRSLPDIHNSVARLLKRLNPLTEPA